MKLALRRVLLLFLISLALLEPAESVHGVIWDKKIGNFVPIFGISSFATRQREVSLKSREQETHNFQGKIIRFSYYEMTNLVNTEANGTKVSGAIGELWNILAEHLNFTLMPILFEERRLIYFNKDYDGGLLQAMQFNATDVIPRVEAYGRLRAFRFTMPLWMTKSRLYIQRDEKYEAFWMLKLFSLDLWHAILWMYFIISACSYVSETVGTVLTRQKYQADLSDHIFYNFGLIYCDQSNLPDSTTISSCIVELCLGIFSLLIRTAFGAFVFDYLSQLTASPPFDDVETMLERTAYNVAVLSDSVHEQVLKRKIHNVYERVYDMNRYVIVPTIEDLYTTGCSAHEQYAILQAEDIKKAAGLFICTLNPVGPHVFESWIASGVARSFEYQKTIDLTILKLHEGGIIKLLRERWIESKNVEEKVEPGAEPINMTEVYILLYVLGVGWIITFLIFILENMIFIYYTEHGQTHSLKNASQKSKNVMPTRRRTKRIRLFNTQGTMRY